MAEYLTRELNLSNVSLSRIKTLFEVLSESTKRDVAYIRSKYSKIGMHFDDVAACLVQTRLLVVAGGEISLRIPSEGSALRKRLLEGMFTGELSVANQGRAYLKKFSLRNGRHEYAPRGRDRSAMSGIRNLLIELEFLQYDSDRQIYFVPQHHRAFFEVRHKHYSLKQLANALAKNEEIGLIAEKAVLKFEAKRLKPYGSVAKDIEHTSLKDVAAGYDIASFEPVKTIRLEKYIEVKAVSLGDFRFYWSKNEIAVAKEHKERYYLYLVPITTSGRPDLENMLIINNPYKNVFRSESRWHAECEVFSFSKKGIATSVFKMESRP